MPNSVYDVTNGRACSHLRAYLGHHERLDLASVWDVRAHAEIDHRTAAVHCRLPAVGNLRLDQVLFVLVILPGP